MDVSRELRGGGGDYVLGHQYSKFITNQTNWPHSEIFDPICLPSKREGGLVVQVQQNKTIHGFSLVKVMATRLSVASSVWQSCDKSFPTVEQHACPPAHPPACLPQHIQLNIESKGNG